MTTAEAVKVLREHREFLNDMTTKYCDPYTKETEAIDTLIKEVEDTDLSEKEWLVKWAKKGVSEYGGDEEVEMCQAIEDRLEQKIRERRGEVHSSTNQIIMSPQLADDLYGRELKAHEIIEWSGKKYEVRCKLEDGNYKLYGQVNERGGANVNI